MLGLFGEEKVAGEVFFVFFLNTSSQYFLFLSQKNRQTVLKFNESINGDVCDVCWCWC